MTEGSRKAAKKDGCEWVLNAWDLDPWIEHSSKRLGDEEISAEWASVGNEVLVKRR